MRGVCEVQKLAASGQHFFIKRPTSGREKCLEQHFVNFFLPYWADKKYLIAKTYNILLEIFFVNIGHQDRSGLEVGRYKGNIERVWRGQLSSGMFEAQSGWGNEPLIARGKVGGGADTDPHMRTPFVFFLLSRHLL